MPLDIAELLERVLRLVGAAILGGLIGLEREFHGRLLPSVAKISWE